MEYFLYHMVFKLDNLFRVMAYNDDCNNYRSTSFCSASHHNMNINNHPFGTNRNFCMIVIYYYYSFQIAFSESGVRYRYYNSDSKSWIPWREL